MKKPEKEENQRLWEARLSELKKSGQTHKSWCEQNGIAYSTLRYWVSRINKEKNQRAREGDKKWLTLEVSDLPEESRGYEAASGIMTVNHGGFQIDIRAGADPAQIYNILRIIKEL